jgi:hypothetical protein
MQACGAISIVALWLLTHPYLGIDGDARIYVGRAMADLDPAGIGRQLDFVHDGQSSFTIFPWLLALAVQCLGAGIAALVVSLGGLVIWLGAAGLLAARLFRGHAVWAAMASLAVLPLGYGGYSDFHAAEVLATPRIFAEAGCLAALALLLEGRRLWAAALWLLAMAIHPIMALPAGAVGYVLLLIEDRRWIWLAITGVTAGTLAAGAGLPVAGRLFQTMDPVWHGLLADRSAEIFPTLWQRNSWELLAVQLGTVAVGSAFLAPPFRRIGLAVIAVVLVGIAISILAPSVLVVQVQLWRAQWLCAVFAGLAIVPCLINAFQRGLRLRLSSTSPLAIGLFAITIVAAILAVVIALDDVRNSNLPFPRAKGRVGAVGALQLAVLSTSVLFGLSNSWRHSRWVDGAAVTGALALALAGTLLWDRRPIPVRIRETPGAGRVLRTVVRSGQVYWFDSPGAVWLLTGRPDWWNQIESGGGLFDRHLEIEWDRRFRVLEQVRFSAINDVSFTGSEPLPPPKTFGDTAVRTICRSPNGPDWIILPVERSDLSLTAMAKTIWRERAWGYQKTAAGWRWLLGRNQAAYACADFGAAANPSPPTAHRAGP